MLRQLNPHNMIAIPEPVLRETKVKPGDYLEIVHRGRRIILIPQPTKFQEQDESFTEEEWGRIEALSRDPRNKGPIFKTTNGAIRYLKRISKR